MPSDLWSIIKTMAIPLSILGIIVSIIKAPSNWVLVKNFLIKDWKKTRSFKERKVGLHFDYSGFIGGSKRETEEILISCIQLIASGTLRDITDAYIRSNITGNMLPLLCSTKKHEYLPIEAAKRNEPDDVIRFQACFYTPGKDVIEGKYFTEFMSNFGDFSVIVIAKKQKIEMKRFTKKQIIKHFNKVFGTNLK